LRVGLAILQCERQRGAGSRSGIGDLTHDSTSLGHTGSRQLNGGA
jgi:hypothetical protein